MGRDYANKVCRNKAKIAEDVRDQLVRDKLGKKWSIARTPGARLRAAGNRNADSRSYMCL